MCDETLNLFSSDNVRVRPHLVSDTQYHTTLLKRSAKRKKLIQKLLQSQPSLHDIHWLEMMVKNWEMGD